MKRLIFGGSVYFMLIVLFAVGLIKDPRFTFGSTWLDINCALIFTILLGISGYFAFMGLLDITHRN